MESRVFQNLVVGGHNPDCGIKMEAERTETDEEYEDNFETKSGGQTYVNIGKGFPENELLEEEMEGIIGDEEEEEMVPLLEPEIQVKETAPVKFVPGSKKKQNKYYYYPKPAKPAFCIPCNMHFSSKDLFELHQSTEHQDERPYSCRHCGKAFQNMSNCQRHETIHDPNRFQGEPQFQCSLCPRKFHIKVTLHTHVRRIHLGKTNYKKPCYKRPMVLHRTTRGVVQNPNFYKPKPVIPIENPHRKFPIDNQTVLQGKPRKVSKPTEWQCEFCNLYFSKSSNLTRHLKTVHDPTKREPKPRNTFPCYYCCRPFYNAASLKEHEKLHGKARPGYQPQERQEQENVVIKQEVDADEDQVGYQLSIVEYSNESDSNKTFKCKYCPRGFNSANAVTIHQIRAHLKSWSTRPKRAKEPNMSRICKTVNVQNAAAVAAILNHQTVRVSLLEWNFPQGMIDRCRAEYGLDNEELEFD